MNKNKNKAIVFAFGRFNPPTIGHAVLINKVISHAASIGADNRIFTSASFDGIKNPIPFNEKVAFLKQLFPRGNFNTDKSLSHIHQIAKQLTKEGYTNVTFVVGSDRIEKFQQALGDYVVPVSSHKFNSEKHYPWEKFQIVSAGERDPDAEGVSGASGTKMREYVRADDFKSFLKYVPTENVTLARKIFVTVKRNLIKEDYLLEGCNDRSIFKAIFLAGGTGSGKDFIAKNILYGYGLVQINVDTAYEILMKKEKLDFKMPEHEWVRNQEVRVRSKNITNEKERLAIAGRLGLIINSTAADLQKINHLKIKLENIGYECRLLYVDTSNEISKIRNIERGQQGGRRVPEPTRRDKWLAANNNIASLAYLFGPGNYEIISNDINLNTAPAEGKKEKERHFLSLYKKFRKWTEKRPDNEICTAWLSKGHLNEFYEIGLKKYDINDRFTEIFGNQ